VRLGHAAPHSFPLILSQQHRNQVSALHSFSTLLRRIHIDVNCLRLQVLSQTIPATLTTVATLLKATKRCDWQREESRVDAYCATLNLSSNTEGSCDIIGENRR
jgi:hypothetical protein